MITPVEAEQRMLAAIDVAVADSLRRLETDLLLRDVDPDELAAMLTLAHIRAEATRRMAAASCRAIVTSALT